MTRPREWFVPKRFGFGAGWPIAWQGLALLGAYLALVLIAVTLFEDRPLAIAVILVPAALCLLLITARTTRGGWRWRWGRRD